MNKHIIIAGGTGLVGSSVIRHLLPCADAHLYVMSYHDREETEKQYDKYEHVHVFEKMTELPDFAEDQAVLLNCAFPRSSDGASLGNALEFTKDLTEQALEKGVDHFINISSQSVYIQTGDEIQTEQSIPHPVNLYGMAKFATEKIVQAVAEPTDMGYTNVRLGSVVSPVFDIRMTNRFVQMIKDGKTITIDQGKPMISFIHLEDVAEALVVFIQNIFDGKPAAPLYNLANNEWMTVPQLVDLANEVAEDFGFEPVPVVTSDKESYYNNVCSSDLFYEQQQWQPKRYLKDLLEELF